MGTPSTIGQMYQNTPPDMSALWAMLNAGGGGQKQSGGGLFGLGDLATGGLFSAGAGLFGSLAGALRGPTDAEKRARKVFDLAQNRMGQNVLEPYQYLADFQRAMAPRFNMQAEGINRRLGLDSGVAQGELGFQMQAPIAEFLLNAKQQNDMLKSQRDMQLLSIMGGLSG